MAVEAFVTYCSAEKDPSSRLLPALDRYKSARIRRVKEMADTQGAMFFVLSGEFALVRAGELIPSYDHLLLDSEIERLADKAAAHLIKYGVTRVIFFLINPSASRLKPYENAMRLACEWAGAEFNLATLEGKEMSDWRAAMADARTAKMLLLRKRAEGEKRFEDVLKKHGEDGMIFFIRGEGYESLAEHGRALNDFRLAEVLFPLPKYQEQARQAAARVEAHIYPSAAFATDTETERILKVVPDPLVIKAVRDAERFIQSDPPDAIRASGERGIRGLIMHLEREHKIEPAQSWRQRTRLLLERNLISEVVGYELDAVREIRNAVAAKGVAVTQMDAAAAVKMFLAALANIFQVESS